MMLAVRAKPKWFGSNTWKTMCNQMIFAMKAKYGKGKYCSLAFLRSERQLREQGVLYRFADSWCREYRGKNFAELFPNDHDQLLGSSSVEWLLEGYEQARKGNYKNLSKDIPMDETPLLGGGETALIYAFAVIVDSKRYVKIGYTGRDISKREKEYDSNCWKPLLLATKFGDQEEEARILAILATAGHLAFRNEFFWPTEVVKKYLQDNFEVQPMFDKFWEERF